MFAKVSQWAKESAYQLARQTGLSCPDCGRKLTLPVRMPKRISCEHCGWEGPWQFFQTPHPQEAVVCEKPRRCRIGEKEVPGGRQWLMPARKGINFFLIFGLGFGGFPLLMMVFILLGGTVEGDFGRLGAVAFLSLFVVIGGGVFWAGLRSAYTEHFLSIIGGEALLVKKFFGRKQSQRIAAGDLAGVGLYESHTSNDKPVYGLMLRSHVGQHLKIGFALKEEDLRWLGGRILEILPDEVVVANHGLAGRALDAGPEWEETPPEKKAFKGITLHRVGRGFRLEVSGSRSAGLLVGMGFFAVVFGSVFAGVGFTEAGFPFNVVGVVIVLAGLGSLATVLWRWGTSERYEFGFDKVTVRKMRRGRETARESFSREDFRESKVLANGHSNNEPRYSVTLRGEKELKLFRWVEGKVAYELAGWLDWWLGEEKAPASASPAEVGYEMPARELTREEETRPVRRDVLPIYPHQLDLADHKGARWGIRAFFSLFLVIGAGMLFFGVKGVIRATESVDWLSTNGEIIHSEIEVDSDSEGTSYGADIRYRYQVKDLELEGDRVTFGDYSSSSRERANTIVRRHPVGAQVEVFFDPAEPSQAVLERGVRGGSWIVPGIGLVFFVAGLLFLITIERGMRSKAE
ncbi:DUF3592 domain-containing protein [Roseibacillus ishigakijimensis]|uniref:DUF3592 domain-containing protein n=1 Tax=Roseibacillus ishigakijimensis TaxID=454146 RepID=A0A934VI76_9BACT|nr:DUF3592 domain-containing protein [Roseibacillus ishigakijimensis]MBK1834783.1 DUF3592 domain-containing protein [Roseibacillus ishigakijimensis]